MKAYKVLIWKDGNLITPKPLELNFKSAFDGIIKLMQEYNPLLSMNIKLHLKRL